MAARIIPSQIQGKMHRIKTQKTNKKAPTKILYIYDKITKLSIFNSTTRQITERIRT